MRAVLVLVVCFVGIGCSIARETTRSIDTTENSSSDKRDNSNALTSSIEFRKHKPYHDLFLRILALAMKRKVPSTTAMISAFDVTFLLTVETRILMGGLQSLVGFIVIKIKVVLVAVTIIGVVALALKIFGFFKYTGYLYKNDYPPVGPPHDFSAYHGPPPDHDIHGSDWSSYSEHYGRSTNGHREPASPSQFITSVNMTEIVYSFMNANRNDCRARLVCEFEMLLMRSTLFDYLMRHGITSIRSPQSGSHSEDCTAHYTKCVEATRRRTIV